MNTTVVIGAIVAVTACTAGVVCALCFANGPVDHTPVVTTVLLGFGATVAGLMALLKGIGNGQQTAQVQSDAKAAATEAQSLRKDIAANTQLTAQNKEKIDVLTQSLPRP